MDEKLTLFTQAVTRTEQEHLKAKRELKEYQSFLVDKALDEKHVSCGSCACNLKVARRLLIGTLWECSKSPINRCVYDVAKDPYHDDCLFCGEPEDRP